MDFAEHLSNHLPQEEISALLSSLEGETIHGVLLNLEKISDEEFLSLYPNVTKHPFVLHAFLYKKEEYELGKSLLYETGAISIQDPASMMVAYFLDPQEGETVLDLCAAPGGKTIGASLSMKNAGLIVANDLSFPRAKDLSQNIERMGRGSVIVTSCDFAKVYHRYKETFGRIILDAPCSGSAMFRKNDLAEKDWTMEKVLRCAAIQKELLAYCYEMLKPGGRIIYSTCSFSYEEDEGVVLEFLSSHPDCHPIALAEHPSFYRPESLKESILFLPHRFQGEGQFLCLIEKGGEKKNNAFSIKPNSLAKKHQAFLKQYGLEERVTLEHNGSLYSLSKPFDFSYLTVLRPGVKLMELKDNAIPDHHLSHYLSNKDSIPLSLEQVRLYLHGDAFPLAGPNGFHAVSYQNRNLGFVKLVNGMAKNHYPKGLRKAI